MLAKEDLKKIRMEVDGDNDRLPQMFNALSDEGRFRIFKLLLQKRDLCVTEIAHVFTISVPAASQQLKIMEMSGVVLRQRNGQMICYSIKSEDPTVRSLMKIVAARCGIVEVK